LVKSSKFSVTADDSFDSDGCVDCVAVAVAVNGFDGSDCIAVTAAIAINSTILSSKFLILKLKFLNYSKRPRRQLYQYYLVLVK
jgi:hypothetical protein